VFISHATADRKDALSVCRDIESRGAKCWISCRDVEPGENYQEAIVRAIREASAMVLVFSEAANRSDEIKKELSLASRHRVPVFALRIEDFEPSDAFAYELSTRQWIDAFEGWDKSLDTLAQKIAEAPARKPGHAAPPIAVGRRRRISRRTSRQVAAAAAMLLLVLAAGAWWMFRTGAAADQALQVRLAGFQRLADDVPATMPAAIREEMIATFGDDAIVRVSTAAAPPPGDAPAYALSGTVRREGDKIKVIARLNNERNGSTIWSNGFAYEAAEMDRVPRRVAIDTSAVTRCGLFGASTYRKQLEEATLTDYFQFCQNLFVQDEPSKALDFARKVVAAVPDYSWGWSAVEIAAFNTWLGVRTTGEGGELRQEALRAADKAIELDRSNSEALAYKSILIDQSDLLGREKLLQQATRARTLPCGCEHHFYGEFLREVGRTNDAIREYRRSIDILALSATSQIDLGQAYLAIGRTDLAKKPIADALELDSSPQFASLVRVSSAPMNHDYAGALKQINDPDNGAPLAVKSALSAAFRALQTNNPRDKRTAIAALDALPPERRGGLQAILFGALGANRQALETVLSADARRGSSRSWLFNPAMAGVLRDPSFPDVANRLGLMKYWKASRTKPDVCSTRRPPPFCRMI
jgi:tetratricopeptide (TPR) repeat protein